MIKQVTQQDIIDFVDIKIKPIIKDTIYNMSNMKIEENMLNDSSFIINFFKNIRAQLPNEWKEVIVNGLNSFTYERNFQNITKENLENLINNSTKNNDNDLIKEIYKSL